MQCKLLNFTESLATGTGLKLTIRYTETEKIQTFTATSTAENVNIISQYLGEFLHKLKSAFIVILSKVKHIFAKCARLPFY